MKALVLVAHGSRRDASNEEVQALAESIQAVMSHDYPIIETGFLEIAAPSIVEAIDMAVSRGATQISVVPYFLASGNHVVSDIPAEVEKARALNRHVEMVIMPHIGSSPMMIKLIADLALPDAAVR